MMILGSLGGGRSKCLITLGVPLCRGPCLSLPIDSQLLPVWGGGIQAGIAIENAY
jgi:hypothetical protein